MPESAEFNPTNKGTLRPYAKPLTVQGDHFEPMELPDFEFDICLPETASPDNPITIFTLYYTPKIISTIVQNTNSYHREPQDSSKPHSRANKWYSTDEGEIYSYFALRIYMMVYPLNEIAGY